MTLAPGRSRPFSAARPSATVLAVLAAFLAAPVSATTGQETPGPDATATFSGGDGACGFPDDFTADYTTTFAPGPDGTTVRLDQVGTDDVLMGVADSSGVPPTLANGDKESLEGGEIIDEQRVRYRDYRYRVDGCTQIWALIEFVFADAVLPLAGPSPPVAAADPGPSEPAEQAQRVAVDEDGRASLAAWLLALFVLLGFGLVSVSTLVLWRLFLNWRAARFEAPEGGSAARRGGRGPDGEVVPSGSGPLPEPDPRPGRGYGLVGPDGGVYDFGRLPQDAGAFDDERAPDGAGAMSLDEPGSD